MIAEQLKLEIQQTEQSRIHEIDFDNIIFGRQFSDHMFIMEYKDGAWHSPTIKPYGNLSMSPASSVMHYGQAIFEGMKAYKNANGEVLLFRYMDNIKRFNRSAERMCMPAVPEDIFEEALKELVKLDRSWIPAKDGSALYIRPFMFSTDAYIGVKPSDTYKFMIFTCPVDQYYGKPVKVKMEMEFSRAVEGGTGAAKAAGNYAASLYPARMAQQQGYDQLVWTDAKEHKYIEESGTMNIMFVQGNQLLTPSLSGTILSGITRDSVLTIARDWGLEVKEAPIAVADVIDALEAGAIDDAFGTGTAATIAHIKSIGYNGKDYELPEVANRTFSNKVAAYLEGLKKGREEDKFGWVSQIG